MDSLNTLRPATPLTPSAAPATPAAHAPSTESGPDLVIIDSEIRPLRPRAGQNVDLYVTVRNDGNEAAGAFDVKVKEDIKAQQRVEGGLAPGAQTQLHFGPTRVGPFDELLTMDIAVDPRNEVAETREDNNWRYVMVPVDGGHPTPPPPIPNPPIPPVPPPHVMLAE